MVPIWLVSVGVVTLSIERMIANMDRDIQLKQEQLERYRTRLQRRYASLESTLGELQNQGNFIAAQINANGGGRGFGISS